MKVAVKKSVLFNVLKKHLNENRTIDGTGNLVHLANLQSPSLDPFGIDEDEAAPIEPSAHMATQLSVEKPPVDDEDYLPATKSELTRSAAVIIEELPDDQVEYYYRNLHKLLDAALDKHEEKDLVSETYDISRKTKAVDLEIFAESKVRLRRGGERIDQEAQEKKAAAGELPALGTPERDSYEMSDVDGYAEAENQEEFKNGYDLAIQFSRVVDQYNAGEISEEEFERTRKEVSDIQKTGSIHFQAGFDEGDAHEERAVKYFEEDVPSMSDEEREEIASGRDRQIFPRDDFKPEVGVDYDYSSFNEFLVMTDMTKEQRDDVVIGFIVDSHVAVQKYSKIMEDENTAAFQMYWSDPKAFSSLDYKYASEVLKPISTKLKLSNVSSLSPLRTKEKFKKIKKSEDLNLQILERFAGTKRTILKMMKLELSRNTRYRDDLEYLGQFFKNLTKEKVFDEVADIIAEDYAKYAMSRRYSDMEKGKYIEEQLKNIERQTFQNLYFGEESVSHQKMRTDIIRQNSEVKQKTAEIEHQIKRVERLASLRGIDPDPAEIQALRDQIPKVQEVPAALKRTPVDMSKQMRYNRNVLRKRLEPEELDDFINSMVTSFDQKFKDDEDPDNPMYVIKDPNNIDYIAFTEDEVLTVFDEYFDNLKNVFASRESDTTFDFDADELDAEEAVDIDNPETDEIEELDDVAEAEAAARAAEKLRINMEKNNDLTFLAPYFGYSGAPGLRQWSLKFPKRKFDMMTTPDERTGKFPFVVAIDSIYQALAPELVLALDELIPSIEKKVNKGKGKDSVTKPGKKRVAKTISYPGAELDVSPQTFKSVGDEQLLNYLKEAQADISEIADYFPQKSYADILTDDPDLMQSTGGIILRNVVGDLLDPVMQTLDSELNKEIGDLVSDEAYNKGHDISDEDAQWIANYFTGLMKDITPQSNMPEKLVNIGINTYEEYARVKEVTDQILKGFVSEFGSKPAKDRQGNSYEKDGKFKKIIDDLILDNITELEPGDTLDEDEKKIVKKIGNLIVKAVTQMFNEFEQEEAYENVRTALTVDEIDKFNNWEELLKAREEEKTQAMFNAELERKKESELNARGLTDQTSDEDIIREALLRLIKK